jgi:hypothetical protein
MNFGLTKEKEAFQMEVETFLDEELKAETVGSKNNRLAIGKQCFP